MATQPYRYQYGGGRGVLNKPKSRSTGEAEYSAQLAAGKKELDTYDPAAEYAKTANQNLYVYDYIGKSPYSRQGVPEYKADKLKFTAEQMGELVPSLQSAQDEHGVLKVAEFDRAEVQRRIDEAKKTGSLPEYSQRGTPYFGLGQSSQVYGEGWEVLDPESSTVMISGLGSGSGMDSQHGGELRSAYVVDPEASTARYIENLEGILADTNPSYASYWTHSKKEYGKGYLDLAKQLRTASSEAEKDYINATQVELEKQRGILGTQSDELAAIQEQRKVDTDTRNKMYTELFNIRKGSFI